MESAAAAAVTESTERTLMAMEAPRPAGSPAGRRSRPALRTLALPTEHGGWGFLFEPLVLGIAIAPSWGGALVATAAIFGFLARQPLKLATQDAVRGRSYPRTSWCRGLAAAYLAAALISIGAAISISGWRLAIPFALVAPLACITLFFDARNRSRSPLPEYGGSIAMASTAAAIAIAAGWPLTRAFAAMALVVLRGVPAVMYVRTLLARAHRKIASSWPALVAHAVAIPLAWAATRSPFAVAAIAVLLVRAAWGVTHAVPPARHVGWQEIGWGTFATAMFIAAMW